MTHDHYLVCSTRTVDGLVSTSQRVVIASSIEDARTTHLEHYPDYRVVVVTAKGRR